MTGRPEACRVGPRRAGPACVELARLEFYRAGVAPERGDRGCEAKRSGGGEEEGRGGQGGGAGGVGKGME